MSEVTFAILKIVVSISVVVVTMHVVPYIKTKINAETQKAIEDTVAVAVKAAEQTLDGGKIKKSHVISFMEAWLEDNGIFLTGQELDELIECVVYSIKQGTDKQ